MTLKELLGDAYKDGMSLEEVEAALKSVNLPGDEALRKELEKSKKATDKATAEAADYRRKYQEKLTAEEAEKEARVAETKKLQDELAELKAREALANHKSQFLALGYDDALATETAQAMVDGDMSKVFANQKKYQDAQRASIEAELLSRTPTPPAGKTPEVMDAAKFATLGYEGRMKLLNENPTLYAELDKATEN